jgi:hypothetical protein
MKTVGFLRSFTLTFLTIVAALLFLMRASPAAAGNCLQDEFKASGASQKLSCTANDVSVAKVTNIRNLDGSPLTSCIAGSTFNFIADFEVVTTAKSSRSNIGLYFATQNQATALTGTCSDNIISPSHLCAGSSITCGSDNYHELDNLNLAPGPDNCGDTSSTDNSATFGAGAEDVTVEIDNFLCQAPPGQTSLVLPNCTSWQVPGSTIQCVSPSPDFPYVIAAVPGSPSKCNCSTIPLGITIQSPTASVTKSCTTANSTGLNTSCTLSPESGTVTYTVGITNSSNFGNIIVDQICDSAYGTVFRAGTFSGAACATGSTGSGITGTTCSALSVGTTPQSCTFTASQPESATVTDTVQITGHGASAGTFGPTSSNSVTVTSNEAASTATITKSLVSTTAGCATVRYGVDVKNTSSADETLTLSALSDSSYGDITKWTGTGNASVLGTTCGVTTGVGSLSGIAGAGTLSKTLAVSGSDYTCQFDAQFCGTLTTITLPAGSNPSTCLGIQHTNQVTGTLTGDDTPPEVVSQTENTLTVDECFTSFSSSSP